jgi:hypothetical protein
VTAAAEVLESGSRSDGRSKLARYAQDAVVRRLEAVYAGVLAR